MKEYVTILHEIPGDMKEFSPEQLQKMLEEYMAWTRQLRESNRIVAEKNLDSRGGHVVRGYDSEAVISDGPYAESKEIIGGLHIIQAESYEEALAWAKKCPALMYGGAVEVREVESWDGRA